MLATLLAGCSRRGDAGDVRGVPRATDAEGTLFAEASNAFGGDLHRVLGARAGNLVYSPASLSTALAMTWMGARGATRDDMTKVLHFDKVDGADPSTLSSVAGRVLAGLNHWKRLETLTFVNRLYGQSGYPFDAGFVDVTRDQFGAELQAVDFGRAEPTRQEINAYVAKMTHDRIKELLPDQAVAPLTRVVLVNAVFLQARWHEPFARKMTFKGRFQVDDRTTMDVQMMQGLLRARCGEVEGASMVELPYKGEKLAMTFLMPAEAARMADLESKIAAGRLDAMLARLKPDGAVVTLPKFTIDPPDTIDLTEPLSTLGMGRAFSADADFTGMVERSAPHLQLSGVFHKAFITVNEEGTEAAAASAAGGIEQSVHPSFTFDRPFLFSLRDTATGLVLFQGRVTNPE